MKVLTLLGSPRKKGNTAKLMNKYIEGLRDSYENVEVVSFDVTKMDIKGCVSCYACQNGKANPCSIKDDMNQLFDEMIKADVIVMASPVYYYSITAQLKAVLDRTFAIIRSFQGKKLVFLSTYGGENEEMANIPGIKTMLQMTCDTVGMEMVQFYSACTMNAELTENGEEAIAVYELAKTL